jgi:hypothetical protein
MKEGFSFRFLVLEHMKCIDIGRGQNAGESAVATIYGLRVRHVVRKKTPLVEYSDWLAKAERPKIIVPEKMQTTRDIIVCTTWQRQPDLIGQSGPEQK